MSAFRGQKIWGLWKMEGIKIWIISRIWIINWSLQFGKTYWLKLYLNPIYHGSKKNNYCNIIGCQLQSSCMCLKIYGCDKNWSVWARDHTEVTLIDFTFLKYSFPFILCHKCEDDYISMNHIMNLWFTQCIISFIKYRNHAFCISCLFVWGSSWLASYLFRVNETSS